MSLIERRELPHRDLFELILKFDATAGNGWITPPVAAEDIAFPFIAHKRCWLLGMTVHTEVVATLAGSLQLETFDSGTIVSAAGGDVVASEVLVLNAGGVNAGDIVTSDMGLANLINDARSANNANLTDVLDMGGFAAGAAVTVETPIQIEEGGGVSLVFGATSAAGFIGTVTAWLTEHPI